MRWWGRTAWARARSLAASVHSLCGRVEQPRPSRCAPLPTCSLCRLGIHCSGSGVKQCVGRQARAHVSLAASFAVKICNTARGRGQVASPRLPACAHTLHTAVHRALNFTRLCACISGASVVHRRDVRALDSPSRLRVVVVQLADPDQPPKGPRKYPNVRMCTDYHAAAV